MKSCLGDYRPYLQQIERLHRKYLFTPYMYTAQDGDISLASIVMDAEKVAKMIAQEVDSGQYTFSPGRLRDINVEGRIRQVIAYRLTDRIAHGAIANLIEQAVSSLLSARLFSYRKGISWWMAVSEFARYVCTYKKSLPDPRDRAIYVLRRDINSYTDSIPIGRWSRIWPMLREALEAHFMRPVSEADWNLIVNVVRPELFTPRGAIFSLWRGVPTGQPISCVMFNFYLTELDHALEQVPGAFYARYSDDILFAHPDLEMIHKADRFVRETLSELNLTTNKEKEQNLYLTEAGRPCANWEGSRGTTFIPFLGAHVSAHGTVSLNAKKRRALLRDVEERAAQTVRGCLGYDLDRVGRLVCSAINKALEPEDTPFEQRSASLLRRAVTDRAQLSDLDYLIARVVLKAVTGNPSVKAFRRVPYRKIRNEWGLVSLQHARNKWGGK